MFKLGSYGCETPKKRDATIAAHKKAEERRAKKGADLTVRVDALTAELEKTKAELASALGKKPKPAAKAKKKAKPKAKAKKGKQG
jgi:hypothetical protein